MDMKLEAFVLPVSNVDRAKAFYEKLGFRLDIDYAANGNFRVAQFTPPSSDASILIGKGITSSQPGSANNLILAVDDIDAARNILIAHGIYVSEVFHYAGGPFNNAVENPRIIGHDPEGRSYYSFASFEDPDGNGWLMQEIKKRLPNRTTTQLLDSEIRDVLLALLTNASEAHGVHEKEIGKADPDWPQWYAGHMTKALREGGYRLSRLPTSSASRT